MTPEGYVDYASPWKPYCYYRQDHLGSIREVDTYLGNDRKVVQKTQYYPSGTPYQECFGVGEQPYKFSGKEMITMHGLNWQDYGARWLDNVRMQWTSVDPLTENHYDVSPYAYCMDNPINNIDPFGLDTVNVNTQTPIKKGDVLVNNKVVIGTASISEVTTTAQSNQSSTGFNWLSLPIYGNCQESCNNIANGNYLNALGFLGLAVLDVFTFGEGTEITGMQKALNPSINIIEKGLAHTLERHTLNDIAKWATKSKFTSAAEVPNLIREATQKPIIQQANGCLARVVDAGRIIGVDRTTGQATSIYTVITKLNGDLITAFPGMP